MSMKENRVGMMAVAALAGFCLGATLANLCHHFRDGRKMITDTVRVVVDTIGGTMPAPVDSIVTGEVKIPIVKPREPGVPKADVRVFPPSELDSIVRGGGNAGETGTPDTVWATVPRTQKRYADSTYTAWVSGYEPRLDSIEVYRRTVFMTKTETATSWKRLSLGLTGGFGYGVLTRKPDLWLGVGCTVRLW